MEFKRSDLFTCLHLVCKFIMSNYKYNTVHFNYIYIYVSEVFLSVDGLSFVTYVKIFIGYINMFLICVPCSFPFRIYTNVRTSLHTSHNLIDKRFSKLWVEFLLIVETRCSLVHFRISTTSWALIYVSCCHCLENYVLNSFMNNSAENLA